MALLKMSYTTFLWLLCTYNMEQEKRRENGSRRPQRLKDILSGLFGQDNVS